MFCSYGHTFTKSQLFGYFFSYWLAVGFQFNTPHQSKFNRIDIWTAAQLNQNETICTMSLIWGGSGGDLSQNMLNFGAVCWEQENQNTLTSLTINYYPLWSDWSHVFKTFGRVGFDLSGQ